jgi:hypothetical protein
MTAVSFECCAQALLGGICRGDLCPGRLATIASFGGGRAGVWDRMMDALAAGHDAAAQMINTSVARVHPHGACIADKIHQEIGRSRGGLTTVVDTNGLAAHCFRKRCRSRTVDTTPTGSRSSSASTERGQYFHRNEFAKTLSALADIRIVRVT